MERKKEISRYKDRLTEEEKAILGECRNIYWSAFNENQRDVGLRNQVFFASLAPEERKQRHGCALFHIMLGSTPPTDFACFDINGKFEAHMRSFGNLSKI